MKTIYVANRTKQKTIKLLNFFKNKNNNVDLKFVDWENLVPNSDVDLIINTTSFGMNENETLKIDTRNLKTTLILVDIIYNPRETNFLKKGKDLGNKIENGKKMFIFQAAKAFKIWHDIQPNIDDEVIKLLD